MHGAVLFTVCLVGGLMIATYLLQAALVVLRVGLIVSWEVLKIVAGLFAFLALGVWWLFDREGATRSWREGVSAGGSPASSPPPRWR